MFCRWECPFPLPTMSVPPGTAEHEPEITVPKNQQVWPKPKRKRKGQLESPTHLFPNHNRYTKTRPCSQPLSIIFVEICHLPFLRKSYKTTDFKFHFWNPRVKCTHNAHLLILSSYPCSHTESIMEMILYTLNLVIVLIYGCLLSWLRKESSW